VHIIDSVTLITVDTAKIGKKGGENSRKNLPDGGTALGQAAAKAKWDAYYLKHPEKLKAKMEREAKAKAKAKKKKVAKS
jgi:hypothetical protein